MFSMKNEAVLNIGFITCLSGRWPRELPERRLREYGDWLTENAGEARVVRWDKIVENTAGAREASAAFKAQGVDLVVLVYGAFTGDDVCCCLGEELGVPVILWAPYEPPFQGERLWANALVAITMNSASMSRLKLPHHVIYGSKEDQVQTAELKKLLSVYGVKKKMKTTVIGLLGYRPTAFYNSTFDEALIRRVFGIRMEETDLKVIFDRMAALDPETVQQETQRALACCKIPQLPDGHLENHVRLFAAMKQVLDEQGYHFSVLKCWPEMGNLKTTPCAVMGRLMDDGYYVGCEGDVDAALAMIAQHYFTGLPNFITDMINLDEQENTMTFWHCGQAAPSLYSKKHEMSMNNHPMAGQGTAFWGSLKEGGVTVARFCDIDGAYKLFLVSGTAVDTEPVVKGTMVNVRTETPVREIFKTIIDRGIPHHYAVVWSDVADQMAALAETLGIEVIRFR